MKVIFVASGNKKVGTISSFTRTQYESLLAEGINVELFPIIGKGWRSYARAILNLRKLIRHEHPDIIHAQYTVCGHVAYIAALGTPTKVAVSILGSFPKKTFKRALVRFCSRHLWDGTCSQTQRTANQLSVDIPTIPTGINIDIFQPSDHAIARQTCGFASDKHYIVWCSHPSRPEKDYPLAEAAVAMLGRNNVELLPIYDRPHTEVVTYMCAANLLLLTSDREGSPNVIKEAMACNCPIVSTDVGDVEWVIGGIEGTYLCSDRTPSTIATQIEKALAFGKRTQGRKRLIEAKLTTHDVALKIIQFYNFCLHKA